MQYVHCTGICTVEYCLNLNLTQNLPPPKTTPTKQEAYGPHCSIEKDFQSINTLGILMLIKEKKTLIISFLKMNGPYLLKSKSPSHNDALYYVWLKLSQWFLEKRFLNFVIVFFAISLLSRLGPSFEQA